MKEPEVSIIIISLNAKTLLRDCLSSIEQTVNASYEIIVVDNGSTDGTAEMVRVEYPTCVLIRNQKNIGFAKATNQAMAVAKGKHQLWLNPDTILRPGAVDELLSFLHVTPEAGIVGPRVLNGDGTFQPQCRRGKPTPAAAFAYFTGIGRFFPNNQKLNQYLLTFLNEDAVNPVYAVSGCCLLTRGEAITQIGFLDEVFFAYGEDLDWCHRAHEGGWKVYYDPRAEIVHLGGQGGSTTQPVRAIYHWHRSMWLFYRKHLRQQYPFLVEWIVGVAIAAKLGFSLLTNLFRSGWVVGSQKP